MSRVGSVPVTVNVTMALQVGPVTLERWREDPTVLEQYALGTCLRNHARTLMSAVLVADMDSGSVSDERGAAREVCPPSGRFAFIVRCPRGNNWPFVVSADDWKTAVAEVARRLVADVGSDARRWWMEHAIDGSRGLLEFVQSADLGDLSAAIEARLAAIETGEHQAA